MNAKLAFTAISQISESIHERCLMRPVSRAPCPWALTPNSLIYGAQLEVSCYISSMYGSEWMSIEGPPRAHETCLMGAVSWALSHGTGLIPVFRFGPFDAAHGRCLMGAVS